jgi:DNA-binding NtrC family response regulator
MADPLALANRPARFVPAASGAIELVGRSPAIVRAQEWLRRAAALDTAVLLVAEHGADAESVARELHARSRPLTAPWIAVDCGASDPVQLDRTLFGVGSSNGASDLEEIAADSQLAAARGGTLYLADVTELPAAVQTRLARIVRDGEVRIDGQACPTGCRIVSSAQPSIDADARENRFRSDLYRRLAASRIDLPPLRERPEDVPALAERLLQDVSAERGGPALVFNQAALALLGALNWPGNLAELRAVVARVVAGAREETIQIEQLLPALRLDRATTPFSPRGTLREARLRFEREYISAVLQHHAWRMAEAAHTLGIQRPNLYRKARQLGIPLSRVSDQ